MRNIVNINYHDISCHGISSFSTNTNELIVSFVPKAHQKTNLTLFVIDTNNVGRVLKLDKLYSVVIPVDCWNRDGVMMVQLRSDEGNSDYVKFNTTAFADQDDVYVTKNNNEFTLSICTADSLPKLKSYDERVVTSAVTSSIPFSLSYDKAHDILNVYVNGFKLIADIDFTVVENTVFLVEELDAGAVVEIVVNRLE